MLKASNKTGLIFFPAYDVVVFQFNYKIFDSLAKISDQRPMFYYTSMTDDDIAMINDTKIKETGLRLTEFSRVNEDFRLFKLEK